MARSRTLSHLGLILAAAGLAACGPDSPDPTAPGGSEGPDPSVVTLESAELDSGGTGIVVSDGFARLELEPAVDTDGAVIPDRWTNLRVTVDGTETDVRRLDERTMEFDVPTLPGGTYGVDIASPLAYGSASARLYGVIASENVVRCNLLNPVTLTPVGDALVFESHCLAYGTFDFQHHGAGVMWPSVPGRGSEQLPDGEAGRLDPWVTTGPSPRPNHFVARRQGATETPEFWVWEAGPNPQPVEPLDCLGTADVSVNSAAPAEVGDGSCLLISTESRVILRDGEPVAESPGFVYGHFVMSDDGWVTVRNTPALVVFDPDGELVVASETDLVRDARFAPAGGPLYVATEDLDAAHDAPEGSTLRALDRATGAVLREATVSGTITAIAAPGDRLWIARTQGPVFGGELFVDLLDPETLEVRRSIAVAKDLATELHPTLWPLHGQTPVLLEDATGARVTYTGLPQDFAGLWSHVVEVG